MFVHVPDIIVKGMTERAVPQIVQYSQHLRAACHLVTLVKDILWERQRLGPALFVVDPSSKHGGERTFDIMGNTENVGKTGVGGGGEMRVAERKLSDASEPLYYRLSDECRQITIKCYAAVYGIVNSGR